MLVMLSRCRQVNDWSGNSCGQRQKVLLVPMESCKGWNLIRPPMITVARSFLFLSFECWSRPWKHKRSNNITPLIVFGYRCRRCIVTGISDLTSLILLILRSCVRRSWSTGRAGSPRVFSQAVASWGFKTNVHFDTAHAFFHVDRYCKHIADHDRRDRTPVDFVLNVVYAR